MAATTPARPTYRPARVALVTAVVAFVLACYGSFVAETHLANSPLAQARGTAGLPAEPTAWSGRAVAGVETALFGDRLGRVMVRRTAESPAFRHTVEFVAFVLPLALGLAAALVGGSALTAIEAAGGKYHGNFYSVFAIMIGGLSAVISGCMLLSLYLWKHVPAGYTT